MMWSVTRWSAGRTILPLPFVNTGADAVSSRWSVVIPASRCAAAMRSGVGHCVRATGGIRSSPVTSRSLLPVYTLPGISLGVMIAICGCVVAVVAALVVAPCLTLAHVLTMSVHPLRDSRSQKWLSAPGMCTVSNVNDRRYSAHRFSLSLAATEMTHVFAGPSSTYVSALWSLMDVNGRLPASRCRWRSTACRIGNASLHDIDQPVWLYLNLPELTANSSCRCSAQGLWSSSGWHCVMAYAQPVLDASVNRQARLRLSR